MAKEKFSIVELVNNDGCFDLQFRKDTRKERANSPTYYRWKAQFAVTSPKENVKLLEKIKKELGCGDISVSRGQARFSVQKINDIFDIIVPYLKKNLTSHPPSARQGNKKRDFELWSKAVEIIQKNKGKPLVAWKKSELNSLLEIQKSCAKYKSRPRKCKWLDMAKSIA